MSSIWEMLDWRCQKDIKAEVHIKQRNVHLEFRGEVDLEMQKIKKLKFLEYIQKGEM